MIAITNAKLDDQLTDYRRRSRHSWASTTFLAATANIGNRRSAVSFKSLLLALLVVLLLLYLQSIRVAGILMLFAVPVHICLKRIRRREVEKRNMLPISI